MNRKLHLLLLVVLGLTLSACGGNKKQQQVVPESTEQTTTNPSDYRDPLTGLTAQELADLDLTGNILDYKTVYFEYNSTAIDRRSEVIARAHARSLANSGGAKVTLEGHADERGTRDYNLALGERRAQAVASLMAATGAGSSTYNAISYGEERPADPAHNEAAWQKNRRVNISY